MVGTKSLCIVACADQKRAYALQDAVRTEFPEVHVTIAFGMGGASMILREHEYHLAIIDAVGAPQDGRKVALNLSTSEYRMFFAGSYKGTGRSVSVIMIMSPQDSPDVHCANVSVVHDPVEISWFIQRLKELWAKAAPQVQLEPTTSKDPVTVF